MDALTEARMIARTQGRWGAAQGQYFKAVNPTIGTGITGPAAQSFTTAANLLTIWNQAPATSNVFVFPDYIKTLVTVVDTGGTALQYAVSLDIIKLYSSGGTIITDRVGVQASASGPVNVLRQLPTSNPTWPGFGAQAQIAFGAITTVAGGILTVARGVMKAATAAPVTVVNDEYIWTFNSSLESSGTSSKLGTTAAVYRDNVGIVCIPPQGSMALRLWVPAITVGATFEVEVGWWEVPAYPA